ncbi:hypothetical protein BLNAU_1034 [Blattamonas nauphoetae]|uniref:Uncharacterized protein n=1 Tax=Blattamonas nauphoetae TaxID=2049346 RepID=A0ABQ9YJP1_9EUKA|nr:hypothetical protein BLNAU_1034 [Blattamonas nauphoetae]
MGSVINKVDTSSNSKSSDLSIPPLPFSLDCSPFLNWNENQYYPESENVVVFRSLVRTLELQPALDESLEAKVVKVLESVDPMTRTFADLFFNHYRRTADESLKDFVQSIVVLLSSANRVIIAAAMKMLDSLLTYCSDQDRLSLATADLIPQIITTINPLSLSLSDCEYIRTYLISSIFYLLWLATPDGLRKLGIQDGNEQQTVHETVLKQVMVPSEKYICHLCVNRFSIIDSEQSKYFLALLARLTQICPYHQPTMKFVLHMPIVLTIPSCLTFFETENSIWTFLFVLINSKEGRTQQGINIRRSKTAVFRCLRMEGIEDVMEEKLLNEKETSLGKNIVNNSIKLSNWLGMDVPRLF